MIPDAIAQKFTAADLAELDARIAAASLLRDMIAGALGKPEPAAASLTLPSECIPAQERVAPAPVKSKPAAKPKVAKARRSAPDASSRRLQVAQWLAEAGPQKWGAIADRFKVPNGSRATLMNSPWFSKGEGYGAKYELTETGRAAVLTAMLTPST